MIMESEPYPHRHPVHELWQAAKGLRIPADSPPILVSLDHDYRYPSPDLTSWEGNPKAEYLTTALKWHVEEWWSQERALRAWREYADRLQAVGENPSDYAIQDSKAKQDFLNLRGLYPDNGPVYGGDSHLHSLVVAMALHLATGKRLRIHHYDAHHDCGYQNYPGDDAHQSQLRARKAPSCDDWIQAALWLGIAEDVTIIYPDWQGMVEWYHRPPTLTTAHRELVRAMPAKTWFGMDRKPVSGAVITYARSSSFMPPWTDYDQTYLETISALNQGWINLDQSGLRVGSANCGDLR
jgi:hypothetical protein